MSIKEATLKQTVIKGDCRIWTGKLVNGYPTVSYKEGGKLKHVNLQRYVGLKKLGLDMSCRKKVFTTSCGNPRCFAKEHVIETNRIKSVGRLSVSRLGRKVGNGEHNLQVFGLSVLHGVDAIADKTGIPLGLVQRIRENKALLPYVAYKANELFGKQVIEDMRAGVVSSIEAKTKYGISNWAYKFLLERQDFEIHDIDLYEELIKHCEIFDEHIAWCGSFNPQGTPIYTALGKTNWNVLSLFAYAARGLDINGKYKSTCGIDGCVNPYHLTEIEEEEDDGVFY